jgi:hypothetical protein
VEALRAAICIFHQHDTNHHNVNESISSTGRVGVFLRSDILHFRLGRLHYKHVGILHRVRPSHTVLFVLALGFGGGVDAKATNRFAIRVFQLDAMQDESSGYWGTQKIACLDK